MVLKQGHLLRSVRQWDRGQESGWVRWGLLIRVAVTAHRLLSLVIGPGWWHIHAETGKCGTSKSGLQARPVQLCMHYISPHLTLKAVSVHRPPSSPLLDRCQAVDELDVPRVLDGVSILKEWSGKCLFLH